MAGLFYARMAFAQLLLKAHEEAVMRARKAIENNVPPVERMSLACAFAHLGRQEDAQRSREELEVMWPGITLDGVRARSLVVDPGYQDYLLVGLRQASLPPSRYVPILPVRLTSTVLGGHRLTKRGQRANRYPHAEELRTRSAYAAATAPASDGCNSDRFWPNSVRELDFQTAISAGPSRRANYPCWDRFSGTVSSTVI